MDRQTNCSGRHGKIVVTVNGTPFSLTVKAQQAGTTTVTIDGYTIKVTANSNNIVTRVVVTSTEPNTDVVINRVVSLTKGSGNSQN